MEVLNVFILITIVCFVSVASACRVNIMELKVAKSEVAPLENQLIISSKEVAVIIIISATIPANSHDSVTIDALTCWDDTWKHLVICNQNFFLQSNGSIANNTVYEFISTQKLITPKVTSDVWQWLCDLSTHWEGCQCNVVHNFHVKVKFFNQNDTKDSTREKIPIQEYQGPAEPKQLSCGPKEIKDMDRPKTLHEDIGVNSSSQHTNSAKNYLELIKKTFFETNHTEQSKEPNRKGNNQMLTEKIHGMDRGVEPTNSFEDVRNSSSHVGCGEEAKSTTWLIFSVASVVIFLMGLVIGVFCKRPWAREPKQPEKTDEQTDEHIYDEVNAKAINNRPPLPVPEQAVYNSPYDHTHRYRNQTRLV